MKSQYTYPSSTVAIVTGCSDPPEVGAKTLPEQYMILTTEHLSSPIPPNLLFLLTYWLRRLTCFFFFHTLFHCLASPAIGFLVHICSLFLSFLAQHPGTETSPAKAAQPLIVCWDEVWNEQSWMWSAMH